MSPHAKLSSHAKLQTRLSPTQQLWLRVTEAKARSTALREYIRDTRLRDFTPQYGRVVRIESRMDYLRLQVRNISADRNALARTLDNQYNRIARHRPTAGSRAYRQMRDINYDRYELSGMISTLDYLMDEVETTNSSFLQLMNLNELFE
ncbi:hypothetical protein Barb4_03827 [Bacteroidales bacterium Barb4]|nr:hypothetical protein Barb4_03827 [Bacteroidales bacterium Barb4]